MTAGWCAPLSKRFHHRDTEDTEGHRKEVNLFPQSFHPHADEAEKFPLGVFPAVQPQPVSIERGRRRACLLLHGWLSSPADFADLPGALDRAGWDVYAPLLPGHGTACEDLDGMSAEDMLAGARVHNRGGAI